MKKKEMIPLTNKEKRFYEKQKVCIYAKKYFVQIKKIKVNSNYTKKLEIIVITQENLEELFIVFVIYVIKYQKRFL